MANWIQRFLTAIATHKADASAHHAKTEVGGLYGINVETLTGDKTLTPGTDEIYQYLTDNAVDRVITLDTASAVAGDRFVIRHNGHPAGSKHLEVKQAAVSLDKIYAGAVKEFIFDGTNWISRGIGTGEDDLKKKNITIGCLANAHTYGIAIGLEAVGHSYGVSIGYSSRAYDQGVAIGYDADGFTYGVAVGRAAWGDEWGVGVGYAAQGYGKGVAVGYLANTNHKFYSIALGYYSECERYGETSVNIDGDSVQKNNVVQGRWSGTTVNNTPAEIFLAAVANQRFVIRANSVLAFRMTIVARDNVSNHIAMYTVVDGLIKRDGANNTVMSNCTITTVFEDDATWDVAVTADDANEALIITVTGDDTNPTQWAAVMDGVETHF